MVLYANFLGQIFLVILVSIIGKKIAVTLVACIVTSVWKEAIVRYLDTKLYASLA